ncbi:MAG: protein phosphatase 2C domain-containing protein [Acidimicrobiia bacterium]|nr:protein phosphatase 2C domain-containing protein [Acidimicrobiia bacterium]
MKYTWATASHVGHVRDQNEDSVAPELDGSSEGPVVVAVADGMGGAAAGEVASKLALEAAISAPPADTDTAGRITAGNKAVLDAIVADPSRAGMGTTMTLGVFDASGTLHLGHVGDSRAYLLRDGSLRRLTTDHTYVMDLVARGQLSPEAASTHPRRHLITRVVGMEDIAVDQSEVSLVPGDRVLMCSDGLTDMVGDDDIERILQHEESVPGAAWALIEAANTAGGIDNTTVAIIDVHP